MVGTVGQQINSMIEQTSLTAQIVRAGVMQLWGEAVFTAGLLGFVLFYLFLGVHLEHLRGLLSDDVFEQKGTLSVGGINV